MRNLICFLFILLSIQGFSQVPKNVIVEHFTNTRCSICASRNPGFYNNLDNHPDIFHLAIHPSSPYSNCKLNNHNPMENDDRTKYYGVYGATPKFVIQGEVVSSSVMVDQPSLFSTYTGQTSVADLRIEQTKYGADSIQVRVIIKTAAAHSLGNLVLFTALVEDTIAYNAPNGEQLHHDVFRKALSEIEGNATNLPANVGDSIVLDYNGIAHSAWNFNRIYAIAILQEEANKQVVQTYAAPSDKAGSPVGIKENNQYNQFIIYPNPSDGRVRISGISGNYDLEIVNSFGQRVYLAPQIQCNPCEIDLSHLNSGLYFAKLHADKNMKIQRFTIR